MKAYKKVAKYWDEIQKHIVDYQRQSVEMDKMFKSRGVNKTLELGCGTGILSTCLAELGYNCTGVDIDEDMLEVAREKAKNKGLNINYLKGDMRNINFNEEFDVVLCFQAMSFLETNEDFAMALSAIGNSLKPGGMFSFGVLNKEFELIENGAPTSSFMDLVIENEDYKIVRLNSMKKIDDFEFWNAVYFIEEEGNLSMNIMKNKLRYFSATEVKEMLGNSGFEVRNIQYKDVANMKNANMIFMTEKIRP
ncbi:MAG TPA: class I SAM-dependent methyltransferase [Pseudobacteroides sp.]|nr:class I SAM-dependent methyltransferase [Pseudobacteroides sp.]